MSTTPELQPRLLLPEISPPSVFDQALIGLSSNPDKLKQISPCDVDLAVIRSTLVEAGLNLNLTEAQRASLSETQFRSLASGRGIGVAAILGPKRSQRLMEYIPAISEGRSKIGGHEGTEGRGLRQFVADTFRLITLVSPTDQDVTAYCRRLNERVFKGYQKAREYKHSHQIQSAIGQAFAGIEDKSEIGDFASIPPRTLSRLWSFILGE